MEDLTKLKKDLELKRLVLANTEKVLAKGYESMRSQYNRVIGEILFLEEILKINKKRKPNKPKKVNKKRKKK